MIIFKIAPDGVRQLFSRFVAATDRPTPMSATSGIIGEDDDDDDRDDGDDGNGSDGNEDDDDESRYQHQYQYW